MSGLKEVLDSQLYLGVWMVVVAALRLLSVVLGYCFPSKLQENVFPRSGKGVQGGNAYSHLTGRTFAVWTEVTCLVCIVTGLNTHNNQILALAIATFLIADAYFFLELLVYRSATVKSITAPFIFASELPQPRCEGSCRWLLQRAGRRGHPISPRQSISPHPCRHTSLPKFSPPQTRPSRGCRTCCTPAAPWPPALSPHC